MANPNENAYSALPQSMSDSDSEKEINDVHQRKYKSHVSLASVVSSSHGSLSKKLSVNGYKYEYDKSSSMDLLNHAALPPMSPMRKFLFYASIVCCLLTIIIFLWVLPCTEGSICPASFDALVTKNWEKQYMDKEFMGIINVVRAVHPKRQNLAVMFRSDITTNIQSSFKGGAMSMLGTDGEEMWLLPNKPLPVWLECTKLDATGNNIKDCLLIGEEGLLESVDPVTGLIHWHIHSHNADFTSKISSVDVPLVVPDVNDDGINDLLTVCSFNNSRQNYVTLVSGKVGNVLGKPLQITDCLRLANLSVDSNRRNVINVGCKNTTGLQNNMKLNLNELYWKILGLNFTTGNVRQRIKPLRNVTDTFVLNGRKLIVSNKGTCPNDCQSIIQLVDVRNGKNEVQFKQKGINVLAMQPVSFSFQSTESNMVSLKGHLHGFIIKLWQWPSYSRPPMKFYWKSESKSFFRNSTIQIITERVILISFNSTDVHVINASQTEIVQLCFQLDNSWSCQPNPAYQSNSITVVDLDRDGSQELISFSSTFLDKSTELGLSRRSFQLVSNVKVIQLETELPKLYEATSK